MRLARVLPPLALAAISLALAAALVLGAGTSFRSDGGPPGIARYRSVEPYSTQYIPLGGVIEAKGGCVYFIPTERDHLRGVVALPEDEGEWDAGTLSLTWQGTVYGAGEPLSAEHSPFPVPPEMVTWVTRPHPACDADPLWLFLPLRPDRAGAAGGQAGLPNATRIPLITTEEEALEADARQYAAALGISLEEAIQRLKWQDASWEVKAALIAVAPERLAGVWTQHEPDFAVVAWFTGGEEGLEAAYALAAEAEMPVEVRTGAKHTEGELRALFDAVRTSLEPGPSGYADIMTGRVVISVSPESPYAVNPEGLGAELTAEFGWRWSWRWWCRRSRSRYLFDSPFVNFSQLSLDISHTIRFSVAMHAQDRTSLRGSERVTAWWVAKVLMLVVAFAAAVVGPFASDSGRAANPGYHYVMQWTSTVQQHYTPQTGGPLQAYYNGGVGVSGRIGTPQTIPFLNNAFQDHAVAYHSMEDSASGALMERWVSILSGRRPAATA